MLISLSGRQRTGKTTIARTLSRQLAAVYLNVDSIEQSMRRDGWPVETEGYAVAQAMAEDNLRLGRIVVADSINPWPSTRAEWRAVGERASVPVLDVELICSDQTVHRRRVESGSADLVFHRKLTWQDVADFDYHPWESHALLIDTARLSIEEAVRTIVAECSAIRQ